MRKDALRRIAAAGLALTGVLAAILVPARSSGASPSSLNQINHLVVLFQENWSFDSLLPAYPGARGVQGTAPAPQVDKRGVPYLQLPPALDTSKKPATVDPRIPAGLPNSPYDIARYVPVGGKTGDLVQGFYQEQQQIDGGKMDRFVSSSNAGSLAMSYYDSNGLPLGRLAAQYTLADNWFHAAYGGSFINAMWLVCGCTPPFPSAPADMVAQVGAGDELIKDGAITPDGFAVNTVFSVNQPHPAAAGPATLLPSQTMPTIGDRLSSKNLSWAWYSGGYTDALAGHPGPLFQFHHQPLVYFANYADGTAAKAQHLKDESDFVAAAKSGSLPAVSFVKPIGENNEHPGYADELSGQAHVAELVNDIRSGPNWKDTLIIYTYDENGGRWDHVAPPKGDRWGPGTRIPTVLISPFARKGFVDHTQYDTTSILRTIEQRWNLAPLGERDAKAAPVANALDPAPAAQPSPLPPQALLIAGLLGAAIILGSAAVGVRSRLRRRGRAG